MNEMVERVARAIYQNCPGPDGTEIFMAEPWRSCIEAARAAIEAMREPTEAMVEPGALAGEMYGNTDSKATWQTMIDEALK